MTREEKLQQRRQETYDSLIHNLNAYGICNVERCCSFGKTEIFIKYVKECGHNVLYLFDSIPGRDRLVSRMGRDNVTMLSYQKLFRQTADDFIEILAEHNIKSVIFDESHTTGAPTVKAKWSEMIDWCEKHNIRVLGGTATETRCDAVNVTTEFFHGHAVFKYDLLDMVQDGILLPPWYIEGNFDTFEDDENITKLSLAERRVILEANNVEDHLDYALSLVKSDRDYIKLIVFYSNVKEAKDEKDDWFLIMRKMFPTHDINIVLITSYTEHRKNVEDLTDYKMRPHTIDVLLSVDMLNQGFHFPDLTGIVMKRKTKSPLIYTQQVGRCMSADNSHDMFVVDMVNNFSGKFEVKNPLASLFKPEGDRRGFNIPSGEVAERFKVHATIAQINKRELIFKLNYLREFSQAKALRSLREAYVRFPHINILSYSKYTGMPERDIIYYLYNEGLLREEDRVCKYEYPDEYNLAMRLYHKYKDTHTRRV